MRHPSNAYWTLAFCAFVAIHFAVTGFIIFMAFGLGEAGAALAIPLGLVALLLVPLFFVGEVLLSELMPDDVAIYVTIVLNGVVWWGVIMFFVSFVRKRRNAALFRPRYYRDRR